MRNLLNKIIDDELGFDLEVVSLFENNSDEFLKNINRKSSAYIKWLQNQLSRIDAPGLVPDGIMGASTRRAIREFQKKYGVVYPPNGKPSNTLDAFLIQFGAPPPPGAPEPKRFDPRILPKNIYSAYQVGSFKTVVRRGFEAGIGINKLTDIIFFMNNPKRNGRQIDSSETQAIREWNHWRDKIKDYKRNNNRIKFNTYERQMIQSAINYIKSRKKSDQIFACVLGKLLRSKVDDSWISSRRVNEYLAKKDVNTSLIFYVERKPMRNEIISVISRSKDGKELASKLIDKDSERPIGVGGVMGAWNVGGPLLKDFLRAWNRVNSVINMQEYQSIEPHQRKIQNWMIKRAGKPQSIYSCFF